MARGEESGLPRSGASSGCLYLQRLFLVALGDRVGEGNVAGF